MNEKITSSLNIRRHNLPHWQQGGSVYFVTFRINQGDLTSTEREIVKHEVLYGHTRKYILHIAAILTDHVHMIIQPMERAPGVWYDLAELMKFVKGVSARRINQLRGSKGKLWQAESYDRIIRNEPEYKEKWLYIQENLVRLSLVSRCEEYPFLIIPK